MLMQSPAATRCPRAVARHGPACLQAPLASLYWSPYDCQRSCLASRLDDTVQVAIADRLGEIRCRFRPFTHADVLTWPLTELELSRVRITWPSSYQWAPAAIFTETLKAALAQRGVLQVRPTSQSFPGIVLLACTVDGQAYKVALDYSDRPDFINQEGLRESSLYIKLQFGTNGYPDPRIIRGGYPPSSRLYYRYYLALRKRFAHERRIDVLGRFGYRFEADLRHKAVETLAAAHDIDFVGHGARVRYSRFLREAATARLCLDLPGNGPFTFRLPEFLGLGSCLIAPQYPAALPVDLEAGVHYVAVMQDLSDLLEACRYYLAHDEEREQIARAGSSYFDRYLHCEQLGSYYLRSILDRLGTRRDLDATGSSLA